ncbi:hypothetical protein [Vibrio metschnikovii]|uniref:hypothetical protein n=1 Tax=Vibrio metschnikovii TaxID=28172 RepID=UPI001C2FD974|nr:hypothetical protein [Vibrio metschnikovii]
MVIKYDSKVAQIRMFSDIQRHVEIIEQMYLAGIDRKENFSKEISDKCMEVSQNSSLTECEKDDEICHLLENNYSQDIIDLLEEMQIVSFCKIIEITIKRMLKVSGLLPEETINKTFNFSCLKSVLNSLGCDITQVQGFEAYDELRCINNCIKHSGTVCVKLAEFDGWQKEMRITNCRQAYVRLEVDVQKFVQNLGVCLAEKIV